MEQTEGVIQFDMQWQAGDPVSTDLGALTHWRDELKRHELIGESPERYDGYGFGNVSQRYGQGNQFIISGSQTGHLDTLGNEHYALVTDFDIHANRVTATGPVKPSSESMTHGVIYALDPDIHYVLHVHSPDIWQHAADLDLPMTAKDIPYGTPEMAYAVQRLFENAKNKSQGVFSMQGHLDGIVAFGPTLDETGNALLELLKKARSLSD